MVCMVGFVRRDEDFQTVKDDMTPKRPKTDRAFRRNQELRLCLTN